jgi:putative ribosome biogenesis GTPase RsgA
MLIDTPGMRELGLLGTSEGLDDSFSDIHDLSLACRFANCTHTKEPGLPRWKPEPAKGRRVWGCHAGMV